MKTAKSKHDRHERIMSRWHQEINRVKDPEEKIFGLNHALACELEKPYRVLNDKYLRILAILDER